MDYYYYFDSLFGTSGNPCTQHCIEHHPRYWQVTID